MILFMSFSDLECGVQVVLFLVDNCLNMVYFCLDYNILCVNFIFYVIDKESVLGLYVLDEGSSLQMFNDVNLRLFLVIGSNEWLVD